MTIPTRYPQITVCGPPRELGRQLGEAAREQIRGFAEVALERVNLTVRVSREAALSVARRSAAYAEAYDPDTFEELRGMAESSGVPLDELMLLQVRNQLRNEIDSGCTSLSLRSAAAGSGSILAQNWDNDPALDEFTVVLTRRLERKPAFISVTQAGLVAYIGLNEWGLGVCLNTLPAPARDVGVPHYFIVRGIFAGRSLDDAVAAVRRAQRAIPANIMLATPQGPADLEVTLDDVHVLTAPQPGSSAACITHTNHCLAAPLLPINERFPELIQSHARKRRIDELLSLGGEPLTMARVQAALRDHRDFPRSICRHANADPGVGHWQTVFSVIIEPETRRMHVSRGTPCEREYEEYQLN
jgi:isopenicillin-N N-acyltransferase-like protein